VTADAEPQKVSTLTKEYPKDGRCRVLSLDGGGAKGFYTLGVLYELEAMLGCPLYKHFDVVFGTSTGAIIASLIALGFEVPAIHELYKKYVPDVMKEDDPTKKSKALEKLAEMIFGDKQFTEIKTGIGIVATRWAMEKPMIFKARVEQAHGRQNTFVPGFGVRIGDAVQASCSAVPFFNRKTIVTSMGETVELIDGGYCANNPTLYAIADATQALKVRREDVRVVSVGVGIYPKPETKSWKMRFAEKWIVSVELLGKTLEINTQSMEQLRSVLFKDIETVRICDTFEKPEMATDFMDYDLNKLSILWQEGRESYASREEIIKKCVLPESITTTNAN
jgi:predicted acylesterase/phospholipase RssA